MPGVFAHRRRQHRNPSARDDVLELRHQPAGRGPGLREDRVHRGARRLGGAEEPFRDRDVVPDPRAVLGLDVARLAARRNRPTERR
jgi:hypothetical protein